MFIFIFLAVNVKQGWLNVDGVYLVTFSLLIFVARA